LSGTIGIYERGDRMVLPASLQVMTDSLTYRGPDRCATWLDGPVGLGHTMLGTSRALGANDRQPARLEHLSITADVRLDSRDELRSKLEQSGPVPDAMLILYAFSKWGPDCIYHLRGDFTFGIWDGRAKTLFCARDHFGIKPFYYAALGDLFIFSNTLNCLRRHPAVTAELNEQAIGDFLLFGLNYDKSTTPFRDIKRLPPAHSLMVSRDELRMTCYWEPPTEGRIRYRRDGDYLDRFNELLNSAVADRATSERVGILLSGGLDSGSVAATAKELSSSRNAIPDLRSYTVGYDSLLPDDEGPRARETAEYLGIPNKYISLDHVKPFDQWDEVSRIIPEPIDDPLWAGPLELFRTIAAECRVVMSGEGADNLMYFQMWPHIQELRRQRLWIRLAKETATFARVRPFPWRGATRKLQSLALKVSQYSGFPRWIAPEFVKRADLHTRWRERAILEAPANRHLVHPRGHGSLALPHWTNMFEFQDPGVTHCNVEVYYPFLDLRMVDYLLAIPPFPWLYHKNLIRKAMRGRIPEASLLRRKTPLAADPVMSKLWDRAGNSIQKWTLNGRTNAFVSPSMINSSCGRITREQFRAYCLDRWLKHVG